MDTLHNILKEKKCLKCWNITCNVHIEKEEEEGIVSINNCVQ